MKTGSPRACAQRGLGSLEPDLCQGTGRGGERGGRGLAPSAPGCGERCCRGAVPTWGQWLGLGRDSGPDIWAAEGHRGFMVHILLKPGLENFEHYFTGV